jgi:hypothetical protein
MLMREEGLFLPLSFSVMLNYLPPQIMQEQFKPVVRSVQSMIVHGTYITVNDGKRIHSSVCSTHSSYRDSVQALERRFRLGRLK